MPPLLKDEVFALRPVPSAAGALDGIQCAWAQMAWTGAPDWATDLVLEALEDLENEAAWLAYAETVVGEA